MSHPDPLFDPDNAYEDDDMFFNEPDESDEPFVEYLYDDHNDFYESEDDSFDDSMDGDAESAFGSCGWGVDEQYEHNCDYGSDW